MLFHIRIKLYFISGKEVNNLWLRMILLFAGIVSMKKKGLFLGTHLQHHARDVVERWLEKILNRLSDTRFNACMR